MNIARIDGTVQIVFQKYNSTVQSQSPLNLTEKGTNIANELKIEDKIKINWPKIRERLDIKKLSNPYDIQIAAMDMAYDCVNIIFLKKKEMKLNFIPIIKV